MKKSVYGMLALSAILTLPAAAQPRPKYQDVMIAKVKPEKRADFEALVRKAVDANRRYKGDHWITFGTVYGDGGTVTFVSPRTGMGDVEKSYGDFMRSLKEAFGPASEKLGHDFDACLEQSRSEIRTYRWDLSRGVPEDLAEFHRLVGKTRWVRTVDVHVRRPKVMNFEALVAEVGDAMQRKTPEAVTLVSTSMVGGDGGVHFYISSLLRSLGELDSRPPMREALGEELFGKFQRMNAEDVAAVRQTISRVMPGLSNPPEDIVNVSRDFWMPKAMTAARRAKPAPAAAKPQ